MSVDVAAEVYAEVAVEVARGQGNGHSFMIQQFGNLNKQGVQLFGDSWRRGKWRKGKWRQSSIVVQTHPTEVR